jgi:hypothetical protein
MALAAAIDRLQAGERRPVQKAGACAPLLHRLGVLLRSPVAAIALHVGQQLVEADAAPFQRHARAVATEAAGGVSRIMPTPKFGQLIGRFAVQAQRRAENSGRIPRHAVLQQFRLSLRILPHGDWRDGVAAGTKRPVQGHRSLLALNVGDEPLIRKTPVHIGQRDGSVTACKIEQRVAFAHAAQRLRVRRRLEIGVLLLVALRALIGIGTRGAENLRPRQRRRAADPDRGQQGDCRHGDKEESPA